MSSTAKRLECHSKVLSETGQVWLEPYSQLMIDSAVEIERLTAENERLRTIVRVNGLRWGHSHAEIDELLNQQQTMKED